MRRSTPASSRGRSVLAACLALLLVLALPGCAELADVGSDRSDLPGEEEARERVESLRTLTATVRTTRRVDGGTSATVSEVTQRVDPPGFRSRVRAVEGRASNLTTEGLLTVTNETTTVVYDPERERVMYLARDGETRESSYVEVVAAARENETIPRSTPGVPALPRVPRDADSGTDDGGNGTAPHAGDLVRVRYNGTERVDGRRSYRLEIDPVSENASLKRKTTWLDVEYLYPLKQRVEFVMDGTRYRYLTTYRNVTFNPDLPRGTFRFDRDRLSGDIEVSWHHAYDSLAALRSNVSMPVPNPEVPDGYELTDANHRDGDTRLVMLTYRKHEDEQPIRVAISSETHDATGEGTVDVGGHPARIGHHGDVSHVGWTADGYSYTVQGPVDNETLLEIARSVDTTT